MRYVLDTHALVWYLEGSSRLPASVRDVLRDPRSFLVIPSIVLAEVWHLYDRRRVRTSLSLVRGTLPSSPNCTVYPLDEAVLDLLPSRLDIHDAIIVATARLFAEVFGEPTSVITCDRAIVDARIVPTVW